MATKIGIVLGLLQVTVVILTPGVWISPFTSWGSEGYWEIEIVILNVLGLIFLLLPIIGLTLTLKGNRKGYLALAIFPIVSYAFGVTALPLIRHLYGSDIILNAVLIAIINFAVLAGALLLFYATKPPSNKGLQRTWLTPGR